MYLSSIADALITAINASVPGDWPGGIVVPTNMPVVASLDPLINPIEDYGIFVIPYYNEYSLAKVRDTNRGRTPTGISKIRRIVVGICCPVSQQLDTTSGTDIGKKAEWSKLTSLQEDLEKFLLKVSLTDLDLVDMESTPPDESFLDQRIFSTAIVLGYNAC